MRPVLSDLQPQIDELVSRVDRIAPSSTVFQGVIDKFTVTPGRGGRNAQITFHVKTLTGLASLTILRNISRDLGTAVALASYTYLTLTAGETVTYTDSDASVIGKNLFYWVKATPLNPSAQPVYVGPLALLAQSNAGATGQLFAFSASTSTGSGGTQQINVAFVPPSDANFASVKIYISGYEGVASEVAIAESATSPFSFTVNETGETVTLTAVPVSLDGIETPAGAPTQVLTLNGVASIPTEVLGATATALSTGVQLEWPASIDPGVTAYKLYRGPRLGTFSLATLYATVAVSAGTTVYTNLDTGGQFGRFQWYIVAVSPAGNSLPSPPIDVIVIWSTAQIPPNDPSNTGNFATVDSIDAGSNATIRIYGTGGVGTSWTLQTGYALLTYPAGTIAGKAYSTVYYVVYNGSSYVATTSFADAQNMADNSIFVGMLTTVASGGGGGTGGGGGSGGGSGGCCEVGTLLEFPDGALVEMELKPCEDWVRIQVLGHPSVAVDANTLVTCFKRAHELVTGDLLEGPDGILMRLQSASRYAKKGTKMSVKVRPKHTYLGGGIRLHNFKPIG